ncbi:MAG: hypothetical protein CML67_06605 [Rhodobacteraceae bacterium]|nr:hypothetical protein [Paracoccaceae bacterium]
MAETPILELSTLIERPTIRIDGTLHELRAPDELSVMDSQYLTHAGKRIDALARTEDADELLPKLLDEVIRRVTVELPEEVLGKLTESHKLSICEVFTGLLLRRRMAVAGAVARRLTGSTGEPSSPGSSAPSEETPPVGSPASPQGL